MGGVKIILEISHPWLFTGSNQGVYVQMLFNMLSPFFSPYVIFFAAASGVITWIELAVWVVWLDFEFPFMLRTILL